MKINTLINKMYGNTFTSAEAENVINYLLTFKKNDPEYLKYFDLTYNLLMLKKRFNNLKLWNKGVTFKNSQMYYSTKKTTYEFNGKTFFYIINSRL